MSGHRFRKGRPVAVAAGLLALMASAQSLTIGPGEVVFLPPSGGAPIGDLVLAGGTGYLISPSLVLDGATTLGSGALRASVLSGQSGVTVRVDLGLNGPTVLSGTVVLDGGNPGDGEALATTNRDLFRQTGDGALVLWTRSRFTNAGTYQLENDLGIGYVDVWAPLDHRDPFVERFTNTGTFNKAGGTGTSVIDLPLDNRGGQITVATGTLRLQAGGEHRNGSFTTLPGATLALGGLHTLAGANVVDGQLRVLDTGTLRGLADNRSELYGQIDNNGTLEQRDGGLLLLYGHLHNAAGGQLVFGTTAALSGPVLQQYGSITNDAGGRIVFNRPVFTDAAATVSNAGTLVHNGAWTLNGRLDNAVDGQVRFNPQSEVFGSGSLANAGSVVIAEGASVTLGAVTQTGGRLTLDGTLATVGGNLTLFGGVLDGNGSIQGDLVAGGASVNPGDPPRVYPGHSPGHLGVSGSFRLLAGAELQLQVERLADGSLAWDSVAAGGFSFEAGSLVHVVVGSGVAGAQWQTLDLLDCGSGCTFASGVQFSLDGAPGSTLQFGSGGLSVLLAPAVPEPAAAWLLLAGWPLMAGWAGRRPRRPAQQSADRSRPAA